MNKKFSFFFLDLDDTLYPYNICHEAGIEGLIDFAVSNFSFEREVVLSAYKSARSKINSRLSGQAASHSRLLYAKEICESLKVNPVKYASMLEKSYWDSYFPKMELREGVISFLKAIKEKSHKLALVTDLTTEIQLKKLAYLEIGDLFDVITTSEEAGKEKPASEIFELAFQKLNAEKSSSVMIGDNYEKDVLGARAFGITGYYLGYKEGDSHCFSSFNDAMNLFL